METEQFRVGQFVHYVYRRHTLYRAQILAIGPRRITIRLDHEQLSPRSVPRERLRLWKWPMMGAREALELEAEINRVPNWRALAAGPDSFTGEWQVNATHVSGARHEFREHSAWMFAKAMRRKSESSDG